MQVNLKFFDRRGPWLAQGLLCPPLDPLYRLDALADSPHPEASEQPGFNPPLALFQRQGVAVDPATDRLWIVNDPDSVRDNYRTQDQEKAEGHFANFTPLLFEMRLSLLWSQ